MMRIEAITETSDARYPNVTTDSFKHHEIVPMLSQQNQALQDMVTNYQTEIKNLREFSNDERKIYEQQIEELQNELKENRKQTSNVNSQNNMKTATTSSDINKKFQTVFKKNNENDYNTLRNYYIDYLSKNNKEQGEILKQVSKTIALIDQRDICIETNQI